MVAQSQFIEMFGDPITNSKGRKQKPFIEVVTLHRGYDLPEGKRVQSGSIPIYGANGFLGYHDCAMAKDGIVTGRSGAIGEVYEVPGPYWPLNTALFSIDTHGNNITYLTYLLRFFDIKRFGTGTGVPTLNRNDVHKEMICDVELTEQSAFEKIAKQADKSKFDGLKSQFIEMFGTPSSSIFPIKKLSEVCTFKSGTTFSPDKELSCGDYMYAKVADMNIDGNETYITHTSKYVDSNVAKNTWLPKGTVVFPKRGAAIHTNKKRILIEDTCVDLNTIGVIPGSMIESLYLYWFFRCLNLSDICEDSGIPQINNKNLVPVDFVVPPISVQLQFAVVAKQADKSKYLS